MSVLFGDLLSHSYNITFSMFLYLVIKTIRLGSLTSRRNIGGAQIATLRGRRGSWFNMILCMLIMLICIISIKPVGLTTLDSSVAICVHQYSCLLHNNSAKALSLFDVLHHLTLATETCTTCTTGHNYMYINSPE